MLNGRRPSRGGKLASQRNIAAGREASMKHQIISTDLRTDLAVTAIALSAVAVCAVIGFMFNLVIAPF